MAELTTPKVPAPTKTELDSVKGDSRAVQEAGAIAEESYKQNRKKRADEWDKSFHSVAIYGLWLLALIAGVILLIYALHLVLPDKYLWVSAERLDNIKSLLVGAGGAAAAKVFQRFRNSDDDQKPF